MERRKFVLGLGSLAAGGAAAIGTGAFESAEVQDRGLRATVVADNHALIGLEPDSQYSEINADGELQVSIEGLNEDSTFAFEDLFNIRNNGPETISIELDISGTAIQSAVDAVPTTGGADSSPNLLTNSVTLGPGQAVDVGADLTITDNNGSPFTGGFTVKTV